MDFECQRPRGLTEEELAHFNDHGYVIVRNVLTDEDFAPLERDYGELVDRKAQELFDRGLISSTHTDQPFSHRLAAIAAEVSDEVWEQDLAHWGLQLDTMHARARGCFDFFFSSRLHAVVESVVGPEITLNPIQHLRPFLPARGGRQKAVGVAGLAPWHQDQGVTREEADASEILTCWIPLVDARRETGCMKIIPDVGGLGLLEHIKDPDLGTTIRPDLLPDGPRLDMEMNRGDLLFMNRFTPHCSQINTSNVVRWSIDCRFQRTGTPTGRHFWPEFIIQSKSNPESVQNDYDEWCSRWIHDLEASVGERWHRVAGDVGGSAGGKSFAVVAVSPDDEEVAQ